MKWQAYAIGAGFATSTSLWVDQYWLHILTSTTWRGDQYWSDWQSVLVCLAPPLSGDVDEAYKSLLLSTSLDLGLPAGGWWHSLRWEEGEESWMIRCVSIG